jgi:hypothetical protein
MVDTPNQATNNPNHSLNQRREERAIEQFTQDSVSRLAEIAACNLEVWQKQVDTLSRMAHYYGDALNTTQQMFGQFTHQIQNQTKRSA